MWVILIVAAYFLLLMAVARLTAGKADNHTFFRGERRSPWWAVAFGMLGASLSGVTFVSVPGMVRASAMTYLQMCMGFVPGLHIKVRHTMKREIMPGVADVGIRIEQQ